MNAHTDPHHPTTPVPTEDFIDTWLAMWNGRAELVHRMLAPDGRQWGNTSDGLDRVVGPQQHEQFLHTYHRELGNQFTPRTRVVGDRDGLTLVSYTWDVSTGEGLKSGGDFNVLRDGLLVENWTFVTDTPYADHDVPGSGDLARDELDALTRAHAADHGRQVHREPALDAARQSSAYLWVVQEGEPGGLTVLTWRDAAPAQERTLTATRPFAY